MKYTKEQLIEAVKGCVSIEPHRYRDSQHKLHSDYIDYIGNGSFDLSEIEDLYFGDNGQIEVEVEIMDEHEYEHTVLANTHWTEPWKQFGYEPTDKVAVIMVNEDYAGREV